MAIYWLTKLWFSSFFRLYSLASLQVIKHKFFHH